MFKDKPIINEVIGVLLKFIIDKSIYLTGKKKHIYCMSILSKMCIVYFSLDNLHRIIILKKKVWLINLSSYMQKYKII